MKILTDGYAFFCATLIAVCCLLFAVRFSGGSYGAGNNFLMRATNRMLLRSKVLHRYHTFQNFGKIAQRFFLRLLSADC
jgi:hypothetical protein